MSKSVGMLRRTCVCVVADGRFAYALMVSDVSQMDETEQLILRLRNEIQQLRKDLDASRQHVATLTAEVTAAKSTSAASGSVVGMSSNSSNSSIPTLPPAVAPSTRRPSIKTAVTPTATAATNDSDGTSIVSPLNEVMRLRSAVDKEAAAARAARDHSDLVTQENEVYGPCHALRCNVAMSQCRHELCCFPFHRLQRRVEILEASLAATRAVVVASGHSTEDEVC